MDKDSFVRNQMLKNKGRCDEMQFGFAKIHVGEMDRAVEFYQGLLDMKVKEEMKSSEDFHIVFLEDAKGGVVELVYNRAASFNYEKDHKVALIFTVDDIHSAKAGVEGKGFEIDGPLIETPSGTAFFYVVDPSGVPIQITMLA